MFGFVRPAACRSSAPRSVTDGCPYPPLPCRAKTETRFNCLLTENRKSPEMVGTPSTVKRAGFRPCTRGCIRMLREGARRVIGATAKPLYAIDGKAEGLDRRTPKTSLFEGGGPPRGRWKEYRSHLARLLLPPLRRSPSLEEGGLGTSPIKASGLAVDCI